ncbi:hypothetical protein BCR42DRAFT_213110 [Absidia repens]|uniref:C2H2-type domain-containing protein n=1 Tax=Absidia repens TaxID=90262 RepID=A0A1X2IR58_9FUNG|nr:hypothetical protein BCR42DRAFT_213110 [Absidia repens]
MSHIFIVAFLVSLSISFNIPLSIMRYQCSDCIVQCAFSNSSKSHRRDSHTYQVFYGECRMAMTINENGFVCPICDKGNVDTLNDKEDPTQILLPCESTR